MVSLIRQLFQMGLGSITEVQCRKCGALVKARDAMLQEGVPYCPKTDHLITNKEADLEAPTYLREREMR